MDNKVLNLTYASSLTNLCEVNSSFDSGVLKIAYTGVNRNGNFISKETFEKCVRTLFNCPIVCNYDRDSDTLGGHDMEVIRDKDGVLTLINLTTPIGCIPGNSNVFWENTEEEDGTIHEYLCAEALLWKRQEAYRKIKKDGIVAHSMEIIVKDGETIDGVYYIYDFEFTAFALIGEEPCFESSSLKMFSKLDFRQQLSEMMLELKESFNLVNPSKEDDNILQKHSMKGGEQVLDKNELITKYVIDINALDFSIEDYTYEELEEKFKAINAENSKKEGDSSTKEINGTKTEDKFALMQNVNDEIYRALSTVTIHREWGDCNRYWFVDFDLEAKEIYCWDSEDLLLYGFAFEMNGDSVIIDFKCKKRKKYVITDFDEGEQKSPIATVFAHMEEVILDNTKLEAKYQTASDTITSMKVELNELRKFKADTETAITQNERDEVFEKFKDLLGIEAFETLRDNCTDLDISTIEEKCYAIKGRQAVITKFSAESKMPKLKVENHERENTPYGGLFEKYGFSVEN